MNTSETGVHESRGKVRVAVIGLILAGGLLPLLLYWVSFGSISAVSADQAKLLLNAAESRAILVDVRPAEEFADSHIDGAINWPLADIRKIESPSDVPDELRAAKLMLICSGGITSSMAARHLEHVGLKDMVNVRGGIQEWIAAADQSDGGRFERFESAAGQFRPLPVRQMPKYEQLVAVVSGFAIKPTYSILSLALIIVLWRSRAADLTALRWSMICFFVGENFCAANYVFFHETSCLFEYLHSFGMLLSAAFATYAILEGVDGRIFMLSDPDHRCAAVRLCGKCIKYERVPCGLRRVAYMVLPAFAIVALMPLCASLHSTAYNAAIYGTFYHYGHRVIYQLFEMRLCPIVGAMLLVIPLAVLVLKRIDPYPLAKLWLAAAMGPLAFGILRSTLNSMYSRNLLWFAFWEEFTELLFIVGVCLVLWIFRHRLFDRTSGA